MCYIPPKSSDPDMDWRIALPDNMVESTVNWFHLVMGHPGTALDVRYHNERLRSTIDNHKCEYCQRHKLSGPGYGLLSEWDVQVAPFEEIAVDLIGPWQVKVNGRLVEFKALTIIDTVTNLVELIRTDCKEVTQVRANFV